MSQTIKSQMKTIKISKNKLSRISKDVVLKILLAKETEREDTLFIAQDSDDIYQKFPKLIITNKLNVVSNTNRTTAKFTEGTSLVELTSDSVTELLGQQNYDTILNAISSVFNQTLKIEAIMALLKKGGIDKVQECDKSKTIDRFSQTDESCIVKFKQLPRRRLQRCKAYAVLDSLIPPEVVEERPLKTKPCENLQKIDFIDTKQFLNEDSNMSNISFDNISLKSWQVPNSVLNVQPYFDIIEKSTQEPRFQLKLIDGSIVTLKSKPQDVFHIATPDNLQDLTEEEHKRVVLHQAYLHWKYCLEVDEHDNLPLHVAVLENDPILLYRHCILLKNWQESVDIPGQRGLSALQLSVHANSPQCTNILLSFGAKVTQIDVERQTLLHIAADSSVECVQEILNHFRKHPRKILTEKEGLWTPELEFQSDEEIANYLINLFSSMFDDQGFTPLMLASAKGSEAIANVLLQAAPKTVNMKSPSSGNTALHLATSRAHSHAEHSGASSKVLPHYLNTISTLCRYGAEPNIPNDSGITVTMLLNEFKSQEVAQILSNKVWDGPNKFDSFMLVKDNGDIKIEPFYTKKREKNVTHKTNEHKHQTNSIEINDSRKLKDSEVTPCIQINQETRELEKELENPPIILNPNDQQNSLNIAKNDNVKTYQAKPKRITKVTGLKCNEEDHNDKLRVKKSTKGKTYIKIAPKLIKNVIIKPHTSHQTLSQENRFLNVESLITRKRKLN